MNIQVRWDENRRLRNIGKHGLDFVDAARLLDRPYRLDVERASGGEWWTQSFAYVFDVLAVLTCVHDPDGHAMQVISYRPASREEWEAYHDWLENDFHDPH